MKSQKIVRSEVKSKPVVIDKRKRDLDGDVQRATDLPLVVVNYVEVGDMAQSQLRLFVQEINATFDRKQFATHFIVPVRHGKIGSDIVFGEEWLKAVRETCVVVGGEIQLRQGASDVEIVRRSI